jgi:recombination protein RecT
MTEQPNQQKGIVVKNYDRVKALSRNETVIRSFAGILGNRAEAQAYISSAMLAVGSSTALMECQPASIMSCALRAATLRLSCDPTLGQAYLVPYNDRVKGKIATIQLGYRGIEQMALRTNKYRFINTSRLYQGQVIEQDPLTGQASIHGTRESEEAIGYFNYFELFNGYSHCLYMTIAEIRAHAEKYSPNWKNPNSKWHTEFDKMCRKTVLRLHLLRDGILTTQDKAILSAMKDDEATMEGEVIDTTFEEIDTTPTEAPRSGKTNAQLIQELGFDGGDDGHISGDEHSGASIPVSGTGAPSAATAGDPSTKAPSLEGQSAQASTLEAYWPEGASIGYASAILITTEEEPHKLYIDLSSGELAGRSNSLNATITKNGLTQEQREDKLYRRDAIGCILKARAAQAAQPALI